MTKFTRWILKKICRKLVVQGYDHKRNIIIYYKMMTEAARNEFREDNDTSLNSFLDECHKAASIYIDQCHKDDVVTRVPDEIIKAGSILPEDFVQEPEVEVTHKEFWEHVEKISEIYQSWPQWKKDLYKDE